MDIGRCDAAHVAPARTLFDLLDSDLLDAVFAFVCENSRFAVALVCRAFRARHPAGAVFRTDVIAMSYTPSVFAWAACLPVPCPPLKCVADLGDSSKIFDAFVSLGRLPLVVRAQNAGAVVHKLGDADEDVRYMALVTLGELGSGALVQHARVVLSKLDDPCADVRYTAVNVLGKLDTVALMPFICALSKVCMDVDKGVQLAAEKVLRKMKTVSRVYVK